MAVKLAQIGAWRPPLVRTFTLLTIRDRQSRRLLLNHLRGRWREPC